MEKCAEMEAKKLPKLRRGKDAQRRQGARRKKQNGGAAGWRGAGGSTNGGGREEGRGKGKLKHEKCP